ncbi:glycosyltransferase family 2 protein [Leptolyngbya sp. DQ-M1]|uniref:glycosyltransferase family 2 protein n=1 Tax=Leptolyngbya sp. DQ-M1 TaxID=2933920 RepID=UPI003296F128
MMNAITEDKGLTFLSSWPIANISGSCLEKYPKISIVSPNYNYAFTLEKTLRSVIDQNYPNCEYIVIDGGSTDRSVDIISRYSDHLAYWEHQSDAGQYFAINKGFSKSTGEIMAWINSDDIYLPWTLHVVAEIFQQFPQIDWIIGRPTQIQNGVIRHVGSLQPYPRQCIYNGLFRGDRLGWIQQESLFWRRSLWEKAGPLRTDLKYAADFELWTRFAQHADLVSVSCLLGGFFTRQANRHRDNLTAYFDEMNQVIGEWPDERQQAYQKIWADLERYQRWKPYTGVRHLMRKALKLEQYTGQIAQWDFQSNAYTLSTSSFVQY